MRKPVARLALAIALLAIPIMMLHDLLLAGDPLYWANVAVQYSAQTTRWVPSVSQVEAMFMAMSRG